MADLVVRTRQPKIVPKTEAEIKKELGPEVAVEKILDVEPPYTDYQTIKHKPYMVDYFKLDGNWEDKTGGFKQEIEALEAYVRERIEQGQLDNTIDAVKGFFKKVEKMSQADQTERVTMRISKMAAYIKFLKETDDIKLNYVKYGTS